MRKFTLLMMLALCMATLISGTDKPGQDGSPALILSGTSSGSNAELDWVFLEPEFEINTYRIQKKVNAGNLKNYYQTVLVVDGSTLSASVPKDNGKNIYRVVAESIPYADGIHGWVSNVVSVN